MNDIVMNNTSVPIQSKTTTNVYNINNCNDSFVSWLFVLSYTTSISYHYICIVYTCNNKTTIIAGNKLLTTIENTSVLLEMTMSIDNGHNEWTMIKWEMIVLESHNPNNTRLKRNQIRKSNA